jgi:hypothetical protein
MGVREKENYLDYVPVYNPLNTWGEQDGKVTIHMVHRGFYNQLAQKLFHTPRVSHIDLDTYGSFIWRQIDGKRTVGELAELLKAEYGREAEPLYDRLVKYIQILRNNQFIYFHGKDRLPK